jgi:hypothetical protein
MDPETIMQQVRDGWRCAALYQAGAGEPVLVQLSRDLDGGANQAVRAIPTELWRQLVQEGELVQQGGRGALERHYVLGREAVRGLQLTEEEIVSLGLMQGAERHGRGRRRG